MQLGLDLALEHGFEMITPPTLVRAEIMNGTGFMTEHQEEVYFLPSYDLYLTGTSEVALAGLHKDEIIDLDVPKNMWGGPPATEVRRVQQVETQKGLCVFTSLISSRCLCIARRMMPKDASRTPKTARTYA